MKDLSQNNFPHGSIEDFSPAFLITFFGLALILCCAQTKILLKDMFPTNIFTFFILAGLLGILIAPILIIKEIIRIHRERESQFLEEFKSEKNKREAQKLL